MESRVEDNSSPEPTGQNTQECYKTPSLPQHTQYYNFYQTQYPFAPYNMAPNGYPFPTPPSDTSSSSPSSVNSSFLSNGSFIGQHQINMPVYNTIETPKNNYYETKPSYSYQTSPDSQDESSQHQIESNEDKENEDEEIKNQKGSARCKRRSRTCYSRNQLEELEMLFQKTNYPEIRLVEELASRLKLDYDRISIWFQNRRARDKKQKKKQVSPYASSSHYYNPSTSSTPSQPSTNQYYSSKKELSEESIVDSSNVVPKQPDYTAFSPVNNSTRPYTSPAGFNPSLNFPFYQPYYNNCYYQNGDYNSIKSYTESVPSYQQL